MINKSKRQTFARSSSLWRTRSTSFSCSALRAFIWFKVSPFFSTAYITKEQCQNDRTKFFLKKNALQIKDQLELTCSILFTFLLISISLRCWIGSWASPTAFSVSSNSCTGVNLANSQTRSCGKNYNPRPKEHHTQTKRRWKKKEEREEISDKKTLTDRNS